MEKKGKQIDKGGRKGALMTLELAHGPIYPQDLFNYTNYCFTLSRVLSNRVRKREREMERERKTPGKRNMSGKINDENCGLF